MHICSIRVRSLMPRNANRPRRVEASATLIGRGAAAALLVILALATRRQCESYQNSILLYKATLQANPTCWMAWNNLGRALADKGYGDDAIAAFQQAIRLIPNYAEALN